MAAPLSLRLMTLVAVFVTTLLPPCVDPQFPSAITTPNVRDSLRLVNILIRRPIGPVSVRRECRMLNTSEFERITDVLNRAKRDTVSEERVASFLKSFN